MITAIGSTTGGRPLAKAAGNKRVTIIPTIHGKLTYDHKVCEPDVTWIIEKWLDRHPEIRKRQHEIRALSGRWTTADGLKTEVTTELNVIRYLTTPVGTIKYFESLHRQLIQ